jgi:uncharacterized protein
MKRIYIFPRYSGDENSDWYQKAKQEIMLKESDVLVKPLSFPNWDKPDVSEFLSFIEQAIPYHEIDSGTYFVGHSVGCKAALLYLNELQMRYPLLKIGGLMCVAGWWTIDNSWSQLEQWINISVDYKRIREICNHHIVTILSDNDPYTSNTVLNKKLWEEKIHAKVIVVPDAAHFNTDGFDRIIHELTHFIK